jgi:hypothetical protein
MKKLTPLVKTASCNRLRNAAFQAHVDCAVNPGESAKSFCDIAISPNFLAVNAIFTLGDFCDTEFTNQVRKENFYSIMNLLAKCCYIFKGI